METGTYELDLKEEESWNNARFFFLPGTCLGIEPLVVPIGTASECDVLSDNLASWCSLKKSTSFCSGGGD